MRWIVTGTYQLELEADDADDAIDFAMEGFDFECSSSDMDWIAENGEAAQRQGEK